MVDEKIDRWVRLMRSYPSDGWDGAAALIADHDREVTALEAEITAERGEGWKATAPDPFAREGA